MKWLFASIFILIILIPIISASTETVEVSLTLDTFNNTVRASVEGGNEYQLICNVSQSVTQKLQVQKDITCTGESSDEACEKDFNNLTNSFIQFMDIYNETNCDDLKITIGKRDVSNAHLQELLADCRGGNETEGYWEEKYKDCDKDLTSKLKEPNYYDKWQDCDDAKEQCEDREDKQSKRELYALIIGAILGGGGVYIFFFKKQSFKAPFDDIRRR